MEKLYAIIVAGGSGTRMGGPVPKQFLSLKGRPVLDWSLEAFQNQQDIGGIVLVLPEKFIEEEQKRLKKEKRDGHLIAIVAGGSSRQQSVLNGIKALPPETEWIAVHDAARPFVGSKLIVPTFTLAKQFGAAIPCVAIHDTLIQVDKNGLLIRPIARKAIKRSQTPQIFAANILIESHQKAAKEGLVFTDDATLVSHFGYKVGTFTHHGENRKITTPQDMEKITMQQGKVSSVRCGHGYDVHAFEEGRPLILAGVRFPGEKGLKGHSDADVICHAVCDSLLGACAIGDIGQYFPDSDPAYKNISSIKLLMEVSQMVRDKGFEILFVDTTLIGESPRIASRRDEMRENLAEAMSIDSDLVSIKATTTEGLGFTGREEGLAAMSSVTLQLINQECTQ